MNRKIVEKGFTLIELLAVILILAVIVLIAIPSVNKIIESSRINAAKASVKAYVDAVDDVVSKYMLTSSNSVEGEYQLADDGKKIVSEKLSFDISISGRIPDSGNLYINKDYSVDSGNFTISNYYCVYTANDGVTCDNESYDDENNTELAIDYEDSMEVLVNPERGFTPYSTFKLYDSLANSKEAFKTEIEGVIEDYNDYSTYIFVVYIPYYSSRDFESTFAADLTEVFDVFRINGKKLILRFAYSYYEDVDDDPDDFNQILRHIQQLKPFFTNNDDIIPLTQVGFVGPWGEAHDSKNDSLDNISAITGELLNVTTSKTMVAVRTLAMYNHYNGDKSRLTIYNDAFLSTNSDMGSYVDRASDLEETAIAIKNKFFGGEALLGDETQNDPDNANYEMSLLGIDYLNPLYGGGTEEYGIYEKWASLKVSSSINSLYASNNKTFNDYMVNTLGYRFKFDMISIDENPNNGYLNMKLTISNNGYGTLINDKNCYIMIEQNGVYYKNRVNVDLTSIDSFSSEDFLIKMQLPKISGEYNVYLIVTDSDADLKSNSAFNIKFANKNVYNNAVHGNYIATVNISGSNTEQNFMQVNSSVVDEYEKGNIAVDYVIDGKITSEYEWGSSNLVYSNDKNKIYLNIKDATLYFYIEGESIKSYNIYLNTKESEILHLFQNNIIYVGTIDPWSWTDITTVNCSIKTTSTGIEGKVPLSVLDISSLADLNSITVDINATGEPYDMVYTNLNSNLNSSKTVIIDGKITNPDEYTDILVESDGVKIYTRVHDDNLYVYMTKEDMSDFYTAGIRFYINSTSTYEYMYEQNWVYNYVNGGETNINNGVIDDGFEIAIPLSTLDNTDFSSFIRIRFRMYNRDWEDIGTAIYNK